MAARGKKGEMENPCFSILQWNAGGLSSSKFAELKKTVVGEDIDVLVVQEANITEEKIKFYQINDYTIYGLFKSRQIASGILVAVRNRLNSSFKVIKKMNDYDTAEVVEIAIWSKNNHFQIYGIYSPPNNKNLNLDILTVSRNTIMVGDFNAASPHWGYPYHNQVGQIVEDFVNSNALFVLYDKEDPKTFLHHTGSSTNPDLIMVSANLVDKCKKCVLDDPGSGHGMIKTLLTTKVKQSRGHLKSRWNFKKAKWREFTKDMEELESKEAEETENPSRHLIAATFTSALLNCAKKNIQRGKTKFYEPFWNSDLSTQKGVRDKARETAENVEGKTLEERRINVIAWRRESAIMKRKVIMAKRAVWNDFLNRMDYRVDGKKAFRLMNILNNKKIRRENHPMIFDNREICNPVLIANKFNKFYLNKYSLNQQQKEIEKKSYRSKYIERDNLDPLFMRNFSIEELNHAINNIQTGKQPGPDNVFPEFITHLGKAARIYLLSIYNMFWCKNISLPSDWVKAKIIPILKHGKPREEIESYRPISLTSILVKTFERMLATRLKFYLEDKEIITEDQAGFS